MGTPGKWLSGAATHTGLVRMCNEDRYAIDDENGIFLVVDGVGGHAAGELAAQTAVEIVREKLLNCKGCVEERVRRAIATANNVIYEMARDAEDLHGMACVLTVAVVDQSDMVIGHVGDSRLYLIWNGSIRKLTSDHSPVGECEDSGELSERQAMLHPRRNEVFRNVGTQPHAASDEGFVEIRRCRFKPDAAFLLCSDGLSDLLSSACIRDIVDRYDGNPTEVARELVEAANEAGGKDNTTALLVAGSEFRGHARTRHSTTRMRTARPRLDWGLLTGRVAFLLYGVLLGILLCAMLHLVRG